MAEPARVTYGSATLFYILMFILNNINVASAVYHLTKQPLPLLQQQKTLYLLCL